MNEYYVKVIDYIKINQEDVTALKLKNGHLYFIMNNAHIFIINRYIYNI